MNLKTCPPEELERRFLLQEEYLGLNKPVNNVAPLVSVVVPTYQHAGYIRDCLDGILMQKTDFPYEIIVGEDESKDGTRQICMEYAENYPDRIRLFLRDRSISHYKVGDRSIPYNALFSRMSARGKYLAVCEGDDYWIDSCKMQKQVNFLEENPDYGFTHADCHFYFQDKKSWEYNANKNLTNNKPVNSKEELFRLISDASYKVRTATVMYRRDLLKKIVPNTRRFLMGDTPLWLDFSQLTKFKYFDEVFTVYRILSESASQSKNLAKKFQFSLSMAEMRVYYSQKHGYPINENLKRWYNRSLINYRIYNPDYKAAYPLFSPSFYENMKLTCVSMPPGRQLFLIKNEIRRFLANFLKIVIV